MDMNMDKLVTKIMYNDLKGVKSELSKLKARKVPIDCGRNTGLWVIINEICGSPTVNLKILDLLAKEGCLPSADFGDDLAVENKNLAVLNWLDNKNIYSDLDNLLRRA